MANLTRCDKCKRLSDEPGIGYIGKSHTVKEYKETLMDIKTYKDYCRDCIKSIVADHSIQQEDKDY